MPRAAVAAPLPTDLSRLLAGRKWARVEGTSHAKVFRLTADGEDDLFVKHAIDFDVDDVVSEGSRLRWCGGRVPVAPLLHLTSTGDAAWLVTGALPGTSVDALLRRRPERMATLVHQVATLMRRFHTLPTHECPYDIGYRARLAAARRNVDARRVDESAFDVDYAGLSARGLLMEAERLVPDTPDNVVTHGDFSPENVLVDDQGVLTGCVDVGRAAVADRYQDIAIMWRGLQRISWQAAEEFLRVLGIEHADPLRIAFHRCLNELV